MAIKINGEILYKRINRGKETEKVMCNGVQIRPELIPTNYSYNILGDFYNEIPGGWIISDTITRDSNGLSTTTEGTAQYGDLVLLGAAKIEIQYNFYWDGRPTGAYGFANIISGSLYNTTENVSEGWGILHAPYADFFFHTNDLMRNGFAFDTSQAGSYRVTQTLDLLNGRAVYTLRFPNYTTHSLREAMTSERIENIRKCTDFSANITKKSRLSSVNMKIRIKTSVPYVYVDKDFNLTKYSSNGMYSCFGRVYSNGTLSIDVPSGNSLATSLEYVSGDEYEFTIWATSWWEGMTERIVFISNQDPHVTDYIDVTFDENHADISPY